eukprot:1152467-Pelagomonas_calceolata.AAC.4
MACFTVMVHVHALKFLPKICPRLCFCIAQMPMKPYPRLCACIAQVLGPGPASKAQLKNRPAHMTCCMMGDAGMHADMGHDARGMKALLLAQALIVGAVNTLQGILDVYKGIKGR